MILLLRRGCRHFRRGFCPDYRNAHHQRFCAKPDCRRASKRASQQRWLRRPENRNYFRESDNACRVREWRRVHPGYWKAHVDRTVVALRDAGAATGQRTLQDFCRSKSTVLNGLVARLGCCALQEDMARYARQVVSEAQCILIRCGVKGLPRSRLDLAVSNYESG
jgi:hypothetical protein